MSIPIIDVQPRPSLGAAFGQAAGTGLAKLVMQHRNEKIGEKVGAPKGFFGLFDDPAEASKAWSQVRQAQLMHDLIYPQQEMDARQEMGMDQQPEMGAKEEMMGQRPKGILEGGITPRHLIAAAGTQLEQPLRTMYETQERKAAKLEASEREPYVASAKEYFTDLRKKQRTLPITKSSLEAEIDSIKRGDIEALSGAQFGAVARHLGAPPEIAAMFETPGSKQFRTAQKTFLSNTLQETMRGTTSGKQIELVEGLLAEVGASREANLASVWLLKSKALIDEKEIQLAYQLKKQGVPSYDIPDLVSEQIEPYRKQISDQYMEAVNSLVKKK